MSRQEEEETNKKITVIIDKQKQEVEESTTSEEELSTTSIVKMAAKDFIVLIIGITLALIISFIIWYNDGISSKKVGRKGIKKFLYSITKLSPLVQSLIIGIIILCIAIIMFYYVNAPKPKKSYIVSLLYDHDYGIKSDFVHKKGKGKWPFVGSSSININGDIHIFVGGGKDQEDALLLYNKETKKFDNVINKTNISSKSSTYSSVSFDMDKDGKDDLIVGRDDGVYFYKNIDNYKFEMKKLVGKLDKVPLAISVSDYNRDGTPDVYLSYFTPMKKYQGTVFNKKKHGRQNILLKGEKNKSELVFKDVTEETNSGGTQYNTFTAAFVDLNNDSWPDIVLSHDSGEVEILKNKQGKFEKEFISPEKGNYMGLAVGDYDNDGDQDLFLTNIGTDTEKSALSLGDLKEGQQQAFRHLLLRNDGNFKFVEESQKKGISGEGFGWGAIMTDPDLDGNLDILFAENTFLFPKHYIAPNPGHYYENKSGKFERKFKYRNPYFGQTPLSVDVNKDGLDDIIWINMEGPVVSYLSNKSDINNNYIILELPKTIDFVNARIIVNIDEGVNIYRENVGGGVGLGSDSNDGYMTIGIGKNDHIKEIKIILISGKEIIIKKPKINSILKPTIV
jgi:hypothetical protein